MPTTIIGVDFSGARADKNTWMTRGRLLDDGSAILDAAHSIRREDLYHLLTNIPTPAVVALDFPFGLPREFAHWLATDSLPQSMPEIWHVIAALSLEDFIDARNRFLAGRTALPSNQREPRRAGDRVHHPESYSPLHNVNPNMLPMTCHGINLMHRWHHEHPARWHVPPLSPPSRPGDCVTLLELMPGALLRSLGLPFKGYKRGRQSVEHRTHILDNLASASGLSLSNLDSVRADCFASDDCLDSVVAAVGAALWAQDSARFHHPNAAELPDAALEGWIYVPNLH